MQDAMADQPSQENQKPINSSRSISDADAHPPDDWNPVSQACSGPTDGSVFDADIKNAAFAPRQDANQKTSETTTGETKRNDHRPAAKHSAATQNGILVPANIDEAFRMAAAYHQSKLFPNFDSPQKVLVAMQFAAELGLPVLTAARQMYVLNGTPHIWGDLPLALVRKSGLLEKIIERVLDKDGKDINHENKNLTSQPHTSICTVKRKGEDARDFYWTWDEAKSAGLVDKNRSIWKLYPKRMMQMRVRSLALKDVFGDILSGVGIAEYDDHGETRDVTPGKETTSTEDLNREL